LKIAIVGSSRLVKCEWNYASNLISHLVKIIKRNGDELITGDAEGIDSLALLYSEDVKTTCVKAPNRQWEGKHGFKERNIKIAHMADFVFSIATKTIKDQRCYHCDEQNHDRTGGCWTKKFAIEKLHKHGRTIVI